jgi:hypothetical protein
VHGIVGSQEGHGGRAMLRGDIVVGDREHVAYDTEDLTNGPKKPMIRVIRFWLESRKAMSKPSGKDDPSGITNFHAKRATP